MNVDRILGKELSVLAWSIESLDPEEVHGAIARWKALRPEERWWLFTMTAAEGGHYKQGSYRWRLALRYAIGGAMEMKT